jgi:iron(III) transport system permease protein
LVTVAGLVAVAVLLPLGFTLEQAVQVSFPDAMALLFRPLVGELLVNTGGIVLSATLVAALLGTVCAWLVERTALPGRRVWGVLAVVPLAVPPFISSFAWVSISPGLQDFAGALLVVSVSYFPLVYLPVAAALRGMDPALEETARSLGRGGWGCFVSVVLPQLRPALLGGMLLMALHMLGEFGAFTLLRFRTFTTELYAEYRTGFSGPEASLLAVVLLVLCLACLVAELRVRGAVRYGRVGRGVRRRPAAYALGWMTVPALAGFGLLVMGSLGVPLGMIVYWLTQHGSAATTPSAVTLAHVVGASWASVRLGLAGAAFTVAVSLPLAFLAARYRGGAITALERAAYLTQGVPAIVVALALVALTLRLAPALYQSWALLVGAYAVLFLPLALVSVRAALMQAERSLEDAARSLGLGWWAVAWRVILPLAGSGIGAAAALVFVSVVTELTATLLLAPIGTRTLATEVWADTSTLAFAAAAPYAALMAALSLVSTFLLARRFGTGALAGIG